MKKAILLILMVCISCSFCACSSSSKNVHDTTVANTTVAAIKKKPAASNEELFKATEYLQTAEEEIIRFSGEIVSSWEVGSFWVECYYLDVPGTTVYSYYQTMITSKEKVDDDLQKAVSIIQIGGSNDYYQAVKAYYTAVKALYSLTYNYPEGYSLLTYSDAKQQLRSDCDKAYAEVELYFHS